MKSKEFQLKISDEEAVFVKVMYFADSLFVYIGDKTLQMNNAYLAIQTKYDTIPSVHKYLDEDAGELPENDVEMMCKAMAKRLNKVVSVSINVSLEESMKLKVIQDLLIKHLLKEQAEEAEKANQAQ